MGSLQSYIPLCKPRPPASGPIHDQLRPVPNQFRTLEEWCEWRHLDLAAMTADDLRADLTACRARIALEGKSHAWLFERCRSITALLAMVEGAAA